MNDHPQHPDTPKPAPDTEPDTTPITVPAPGEALSVEAIIEQARTTRRRSSEDLARKLDRGEYLSGEEFYDTLRAQTLATWWLLVERHIRHVGGGLPLEQTLAKFVCWISSYLDNNDATPDVALSVGVLGPEIEHEFALIHFNRAWALIRRDAARTFRAQVEALAPASTGPEQAPSSSAGQEPTA
ncbi:hypothetical protein [Nonomuraea typhae]|uniref:hypothetical protein n=1 Tax=Nonomuraea typhae TaxID=2603600 RepID=UPI0012F97A8D|nr:hypothetical protein [Nonomuraea typhae]